jgi:hypothetical protein
MAHLLRIEREVTVRRRQVPAAASGAVTLLGGARVVRPANRGEARAWLDAHLAAIRTTGMPSDCILWPFSTNGGRGGRYPQIKINGAMVPVSRYVLEQVLGRPLEAGVLVRHGCDTPLCVNPFHFEPGSHAENMADMTKRRRQATGERNGRACLTEEDVLAIRWLYSDSDRREPVSTVARGFRVSPRTITEIIAGKAWSSLK